MDHNIRARRHVAHGHLALPVHAQRRGGSPIQVRWCEQGRFDRDIPVQGNWGSGTRAVNATYAFSGGQFDGTYNDETKYFVK